MNKETLKKCKNKECNNPVLNGKYCEQCTQKRKEDEGVFLSVGGLAILGIIVAIKKRAFEQGLKFVSKAAEVILRKS